MSMWGELVRGWTLPLSVALVPLWSSGYLAGSFGVRHADPLTLTFWRFMIAGVLASAVSALLRPRRPARRDVVLSVMVGLLLQAAQGAGIYLGLRAGVPAGVSALVLGLSPVVIAIAAWMLRSERLGIGQVVGSALGCCGVIVAVVSELGTTGWAVGFTVLGLAGFVSGTLIQREVGQRVDVSVALAIQFLSAAIMVLPLAATTGSLSIPLEWTAWGPVLWLAVVNSLLAVATLAVLLQVTSAARASSLFYLMPPVTGVLAVPVLHQAIRPTDAVALAVTAIGVLLVARGRRPISRHYSAEHGRVDIAAAEN